MNLHEKFGAQAGSQITQLQQGHQPRVPMPSGMAFVKQEDQKPALPNMAPYPAQMPQLVRPPVKSNQTDGADEALDSWKAEVSRVKEFAEKNPGGGDRFLKQLVFETQQRYEAGGLMVPLEERKGIKRKIASPRNGESSNGTESVAGLSSLNRAQMDAAGDDDESQEADEDAINSDLDDPNEAAGDEENDEATDQVMLCTYDKVQRVKNKWKCTLKDGILRVDGTEYV